ncbi:hypothetical protein HHK36_027111 [Tetracentron sinense]|uniref:GPI transamidase component PIG-S n=1 Tax=Tetracentron sinense TaxID=13715 RepID=A0A835D394_TETSI|nr:hypothetical protein HHK36_027111 [Tetracentron sinense]
MCIQGKHWGLLYILKGIKPHSFEELVTWAHDIEFSIIAHGDPQENISHKENLRRFLKFFSVFFSFLHFLTHPLKEVKISTSPKDFCGISLLRYRTPSHPFSIYLQLHDIFMLISCNSSLCGIRSQDLSHERGHNRPPLKQEAGYHLPTVTLHIHCTMLYYVMLMLVDDEAVDEVLDSILEGNGDCSDSGGKIYSVVVMNRDEESRVVIGKHRHAWILGRDWEMDAAVPRIADIFVKFFMNGGREEGLVHGELMPVGADGRVILSFSLLNADPHDWIYDWDFRTIDENLLAPVIEALAPVANISVESQVLYHTPKSSSFCWAIKWDPLIVLVSGKPILVNSNEWHLDTSIAASGRSKILQVVVYIPSANECPLRLQLPNGEISITNGFISPMWGGVIIWNPPSCLKDSESRHPARHTISSLDLQMVFEVFMGQLRQLFGLNSSNLHVAELGISNLLASERGFTEWELDVLSRHHTCFNLLSCVTTLGSLSRLVQSLPRMIIMDEIGKQVKFSLEDAKLAQSNASLGTYDGSAVSSRQARALAEDAFFHPSIMSVSYYSFEHCFAIYTPFFLPVLLHVLLAAFKEWRRYKRERTKYLAWKVKANVAS